MKHKLGHYPIKTRVYLVVFGLCSFIFLLIVYEKKINGPSILEFQPLYQLREPSFDVIDISNKPSYRRTTNGGDEDTTVIPWAVSYSPFTTYGDCKPLLVVSNDLQKIYNVGIDAVRLYSTDCEVLDALLNVKAEATRAPLQVILGIHPYLHDEDLPKKQQHKTQPNLSTAPYITRLINSLSLQLAEISDWGHWDRIEMLVVGSQGEFSENYSRADLVKLIRFVRLHVQSYEDFHGLITTAEPVQSWVSATKFNARSISEYKDFQQHNAPWQFPIEGVEFRHGMLPNDDQFEDIEDNDLCAAVDVVSLIVHPYYNSALNPEDSGRLISRDVRFTRYLCSDDFIGRAHRQDIPIEQIDSSSDSPPVIVLEAGWPSDGLNNGYAIPGTKNQRIALDAMVNARDSHSDNRIPVCVYSYFDEQWRDPGELNAEQSFGINHLY